MEKLKLYRIIDGLSVEVTPKRPTTSGYTTEWRLIADPQMVLTNGRTRALAVDTKDPDSWYEIPLDTDSEVDENA